MAGKMSRKTMKAIRAEAGAPPRLVLAQLPVPEPGPSEVLIKVAAAGLNRADLLQAEGRYPPPKGAPETLGMEVSGVIAAADPGVSRWREGDEVCALIPGGGYAEFALASELCVLPVPKNVALRDAAALPEAFFTVWTNVFDSARLQSGETFLVHGGTSGIGTAAIQLMHARGHRVFTTAGSAEKCAVCVKLGATRAIDYRKEDFVEVIRAETGNGVDVILDMVGGDYVQRNLNALARGGRLVNIAFQKGGRAEVDFQIMLVRSLSMMATTLRPRSNAEKGRIRDAVWHEVWPLIDAGRITPVIDSTFPLADADKAHARMRESGHIGKILLDAQFVLPLSPASR
jgi:putative PIG3 family NAD(P)H quinone oxidoreductase